MFDFKTKERQVPSLLAAMAILLLAGTLLYMVVVPPPSVAGIAKGRARSRQQVESEIKKAKERTIEANLLSQGRVWQGDQDAVLATILAQLTSKTRGYKLTLAAFRPQRPRVIDPLTELPATVQISGPYPSVVAFLSSLDRSDNKIVLRSAQISAADGATGQVTALLGLSAYVERKADTKVADSKENGGARG